jgi:hypothetical protein
MWLGIPYFAITLTLKASRHEDFYDPAIRVIHTFKQIILRSLSGNTLTSIFHVLRKSYNRKTFLNLFMHAHFGPVMVKQITPTATTLTQPIGGQHHSEKKLQTRGPYAPTHHPGTTIRLLCWLIQSVFYKKF